MQPPTPPRSATAPPAHPRRAARRTVRRLLLCLVAVLLAVGSAAVAGAQETTPSTATASTPATVAATDVTTPVQDDVDLSPNMIPDPNSGRAPRDAGERGGWMQELLFFAVCGAVLFIGALVWRESRVKRRRQGRLT